MKLLFDEQLSPRLPALLRDVFPGATHVHTLGLGSVDDAVVRLRAKDDGLTIVTKDSDFVDLALSLGVPPQVVWLRSGNVPTAAIASLLRRSAAALAEFAANENAKILILGAESTNGSAG
ncbi:MAG: DUF5615 family PIN-like protein [Planctomycetota bacterium]